MKHYLCVLLTVVAVFSAPVLAGVAVTSFTTGAQTNGYAPLSQAEYYDKQDFPNFSPASAGVSDNWSGTNVGGNHTTWNMVTSAKISMTTTFTSSNLDITGSGSFNYDLATTAGFVDPTSVTTLYVPGGGGGYQGVFTVDTPATYTVSAQLNSYGIIQLSSFQNGVIYQQFNFGTSPKIVSTSGALLPGQYQINVTANDTVPNLPPGINDIAESGGFSNFSFIVQTPEPASGIASVLGLSILISHRRQRG